MSQGDVLQRIIGIDFGDGTEGAHVVCKTASPGRRSYRLATFTIGKQP